MLDGEAGSYMPS